MVKFRKLNLLSDFCRLGTFDLIFCRNVLIYFDETKVDVLDRLSRAVASDGCLVSGAAENVVGLTDSFKIVPDQRGLYAPNARRSSAVAPERSVPRLVAVNGGRRAML
jgi:chemotaxis protein methyltransferase CheR